MRYPADKREPQGIMTLRILKTIKVLYKVQGFPPTVRQIAAAVGLASPDTVQYHIGKLRDAGRLNRNPKKFSRTLLATKHPLTGRARRL